MIRTFLFACLLLSSVQMIGQSAARNMLDGFFTEYAAGDPESAFAYVNGLRSGQEGPRGALNIADLQQQFITLEKQFGSYYGYDLIQEEQLGPNFERYICLVRYQQCPIRFMFEFYRPDQTWKLFTLRIDRRLNTEIRESGAKTFEFRF